MSSLGNDYIDVMLFVLIAIIGCKICVAPRTDK